MTSTPPFCKVMPSQSNPQSSKATFSSAARPPRFMTNKRKNQMMRNCEKIGLQKAILDPISDISVNATVTNSTKFNQGSQESKGELTSKDDGYNKLSPLTKILDQRLTTRPSFHDMSTTSVNCFDALISEVELSKPTLILDSQESSGE